MADLSHDPIGIDSLLLHLTDHLNILILQGEVAPLEIWNKVSLAYYRARKHEQFAQILNEVCGNNEDDAGAKPQTFPTSTSRTTCLDSWPILSTMDTFLVFFP